LNQPEKLFLAHSARPAKFGFEYFLICLLHQKPAEVKMGKGKGDPVGYQTQVWPGRIMFEVDGIDEATAKEALRKAGTKLAA
jgi:large subunit ribosomal protein L16